MKSKKFFGSPKHLTHKRYEALRSFYIDQISAEKVAKKFGYTLNTFYSITRDFHDALKKGSLEEEFFISKKIGRHKKENGDKIDKLIIELRKKYLSVPDIKAILDTQIGRASCRERV